MTFASWCSVTCARHQRGVFHVHVVLGYRAGRDRVALDTFRDTLRRKRGAYGFGIGWRGSFDAGQPDRFTGADAGRYISKYLRPDAAKTSFVPLLQAVAGITPRDTTKTGVTMGYLRFRRWVYVVWGKKRTDQMTAGEWRKLWSLRKRFSIVPTPGGPFEGRGPPVRRRSHSDQVKLTNALHYLRWERLEEGDLDVILDRLGHIARGKQLAWSF